jgi:mono/diheme cytochrome c family protein
MQRLRLGLPKATTNASCEEAAIVRADAPTEVQRRILGKRGSSSLARFDSYRFAAESLVLCALRVVIVGLLIATFCSGYLAAADAPWKIAEASDSKTVAVDLSRHTQQVFRAHCVSCHGADDHRNGLSLDTFKGAERGGNTGRPILGGTLVTNEIYRRVSSTDSTYRMPKGSGPLSQEETELIRQWVLAGSPWPDEESSFEPIEKKSLVDTVLEAGIAFSDWLRRNPYYPQFCWIVPIALVVTVILERFRRLAARVSTPKRWSNILSSITGGQILFVWLVIAAAFVGLHMRAERDEALQTAAELRAMIAAADSRDTIKIWGDPPIPTRMAHPKSLHRTYYRGNCERDKELFNGGNYCTATFHVGLRTASGTPLEYGQLVPDEDLVVHFELHRAPGTTDQLFAPDMIAGVFLSKSSALKIAEESKNSRVSLQTLRSDWQWACDVPVTETVSNAGRRSGLLYLQTGSLKNPELGQIQYGIQYDIHIQDNRIEPDSDIWMGCLWINGAVQPPPPKGQVPLSEWFDWRPIPEISGPNSTDPKLLGILDHLPEPDRERNSKGTPGSHDNKTVVEGDEK